MDTQEYKYKELKKKYAILLKQHQMILTEYHKINEELQDSTQEKRLLQARINEILGKSNEEL